MELIRLLLIVIVSGLSREVGPLEVRVQQCGGCERSSQLQSQGSSSWLIRYVPFEEDSVRPSQALSELLHLRTL